MRLNLDARARRLLRRLPRYSFYSIAELMLLAGLALVSARLFWTIVTPVDPLGDWRIPDRTATALANRGELFGGFDPFFRLQDSGTVVVSSLQLKLFGTRINEASGRGSAIIAGPDGVQTSFAVGEEILPGVVLKAVAFDNVTIDRGGASEQIFIDQSGAAPPPPATTGVPAASISLDGPVGGQSLTAQQIQSGVQFLPRTDGGRVNGLVLRASGDGAVFRAAGFRDGDILVSINGQPISSAADAQRLSSQLTPGANISVQVERGAETVPIALSIAR